MPEFDNTNKVPESNNTSKVPRQKSSERNALHDFASYNCLFTLSGLYEKQLTSQKKFLTDPVNTNIIARSSGIGDYYRTAAVNNLDENGVPYTKNEKSAMVADILYDPAYKDSGKVADTMHDIFFENVNIISTVGPNVERNLSNFTKMTFELHEPYGITLLERLRVVAFRNGYKDYQAAPFLLTINWVGFDEQGNPMNKKAQSLERRVPIFITRVEFEVNAGGAVYTVTAVPYPEMAFDDSFKFPRTQFPTNVSTIGAWINSTETALRAQMIDEQKGGFREFEDFYKFDISEIKHLLGAGMVSSEETESILHTGTPAEVYGPDDEMLAADQAQIKQKETGMHLDKYSSLPKAFEDVIRSTDYFQNLTQNFWKNLTGAQSQQEVISTLMDEDKFVAALSKVENQYVDWFMIKPQVTNIGDTLDSITKMLPKTITFKAIPYKVHIAKLLTPGINFGKLDFKSMARRKYNYIYTGENVDVQNLRINYKTAYFHRNIRDDDSATGDTGKFKSITAGLKKLFGKEDYPEPTLPLRQYPSVLKQVNFAKRISPQNAKAQEFYDYLLNPTADMMVVELEILGDPAYVAQDIFSPYYDKILQDGQYDDQRDVFNMQSYMPIVSLDYRMPTDINDKEGKMFTQKSLESNLFFSGGYQVVKVDSSMNQGQFTQILTMVRLNNQDGDGQTPLELKKAAQGGLDEILSEENLKKYYSKFFRT